MTQNYDAAEKNMVLNQFTSSVEGLIPHAVQNLHKSFETPLRWHEPKFTDVRPTDFNLWAKVGARGVNLSVQLDISGSEERILKQRYLLTRRDLIGRIHIADSAPDIEGVDYTDTGITLPVDGPMILDRSAFVKSDEGELRGSCVGYWSTQFGYSGDDDDMRNEVLEYVQNAMEEASEKIPHLQKGFLEENGYTDTDRYLKRESVRQLGSLGTHRKLRELGIPF